MDVLALFVCPEAQQMSNFPYSPFVREAGCDQCEIMHLAAFSEDIPNLTANVNFHLRIQLRYRGWVLHPPKQQLTWDYEAPAGSRRLSNYYVNFLQAPIPWA